MSGEDAPGADTRGNDNPPTDFPEISRILENLPAEQREALTQYVSEMSYVGHFSGPIPPPSVLAQYGQEVQRIIVDDSVQRGQRRMTLEERVLDASIQQEKLGMWLGFVLAFSMIICGTAVILSGSSIEGLALIAADILAISIVYVQDRRNRPV